MPERARDRSANPCASRIRWAGKDEVESGHVNLAVDIAAMPLKRLPDTRPADCRCRTTAAARAEPEALLIVALAALSPRWLVSAGCGCVELHRDRRMASRA